MTQKRDKADFYNWNEPFLSVTEYICISEHAWRDSFRCVTRLISMCASLLISMCEMTHFETWHNTFSFSRCACRDVPHLDPWHDSIPCVWHSWCSWVKWLVPKCDRMYSRLGIMCDMTHSDVWQGSFAYHVTYGRSQWIKWLISKYDRMYSWLRNICDTLQRAATPCNTQQHPAAFYIPCCRPHEYVLLCIIPVYGEVGGWGRDPKKCTGRDWGMGSSTI